MSPSALAASAFFTALLHRARALFRRSELYAPRAGVGSRACCGPGVIVANMAKVKKAGQLPKARWASGLMVMRSVADGDEKTATEGAIRMLEVVFYALEMLECVRRVLLCMLEAVEGELCLLEVLDAGGNALCATLYARGCGG